MYLISLYFDDAANERIQSYMNQIAKRTGNDAMHAGKVPPHITLSAFETTQESEAVAVFEDLAKEFICGEIMWCSVGIFFPHTIYLLPVMNHYLFRTGISVYKPDSSGEDSSAVSAIFLDTAQYDWKAAVADRIKRGICSDAGAVWHVPWNCGRHRSCKDESVHGYLSGVV